MQFYTLFALALFCLAILSPVLADKKKGDMTSYLKRTGAKFLSEVAARPNIIKLKSGMLVEVLKTSDKPNAKSPTASDACKVTYAGTFKDGKQFDAGTTTFAPNQVIRGWTEAMQLMGEGDKWKLYIPYDLAYGESGSGGRIPPYSPLVFEIEIHSVDPNGGKPIAQAREMFKAAVESGSVEL